MIDTRLDRRRFLQLGAAALSLAGAGCAPAGVSSRVPRGGRVIVIGAGFAGVAAARELEARGYQVTLLEARDQVGGRARTLREFGPGVDLGASFLHGGPGNPMKRVAYELGLATRVSDYSRFALFDVTAQGVSRTDLASRGDALAAFDEALRAAALRPYLGVLARRWLGLGATGVSVGEVLDGALASMELPATERRLLGSLLRTTTESFYAFPVEELSFENFLIVSQTDAAESLLPVGERLMLDGMQALLERLAEGLPVRHGEVVERIAWDGGGVRITTARGLHTGDGVVVTVPVGVLRAGAIRFEPRLPESHLRALASLDMGILNKAVLRFPRVAWPEDAEFIGVHPRDTDQCPFFLNLVPYTGEPILISFNGGHLARRIEAQSDAQVVGERLGWLRSVLGAVPEPEAVRVTRWGADPYTRGSYACVPVGGRVDAMDALAQPVDGRVFLAGEATHTHDPGTVHGAWWSGLRAVAQIGTGAPGVPEAGAGNATQARDANKRLRESAASLQT